MVMEISLIKKSISLSKQAYATQVDKIEKAYPNKVLLTFTQTVKWTILLLLGLVVSYKTLLILPPWIGLIFLGIGPIIMWHWWKPTAKKCDWSWFIILKTYSVAFFSSIFMLAMILEQQYVLFFSLILYFLMILNILEAVVFDFQVGSKVNAFAGLLLAASTPQWGMTYVSNDGIMYPASMIWIIAYTMWNFGFIYSVSKRVYAHHIAVLLAPFIISLWYGQAVWFQARVFTLTLFMMVYNSFFPWFFLSYNSERWHSRKMENILPFVNLFLSLFSLLSYTAMTI